MPIVDVEIVGPLPPAAVALLADRLGEAFRSAPGRTWLRLRQLAADAYAENASPPVAAAAELPVFVTVLHARPPAGDALDAEVATVTRVVAGWCARSAACVHVQYAPAAAGRQAFGGSLLR